MINNKKRKMVRAEGALLTNGSDSKPMGTSKAYTNITRKGSNTFIRHVLHRMLILIHQSLPHVPFSIFDFHVSLLCSTSQFHLFQVFHLSVSVCMFLFKLSLFLFLLYSGFHVHVSLHVSFRSCSLVCVMSSCCLFDCYVSQFSFMMFHPCSGGGHVSRFPNVHFPKSWRWSMICYLVPSMVLMMRTRSLTKYKLPENIHCPKWAQNDAEWS
jgi:hypothetical protein